jgi:hypothetical protein
MNQGEFATLGVDEVTVSTGRRVGSLLPLQVSWCALEGDRLLAPCEGSQCPVRRGERHQSHRVSINLGSWQ